MSINSRRGMFKRWGANSEALILAICLLPVSIGLHATKASHDTSMTMLIFKNSVFNNGVIDCSIILYLGWAVFRINVSHATVFCRFVTRCCFSEINGNKDFFFTVKKSYEGHVRAAQNSVRERICACAPSSRGNGILRNSQRGVLNETRSNANNTASY